MEETYSERLDPILHRFSGKTDLVVVNSAGVDFLDEDVHAETKSTQKLKVTRLCTYSHERQTLY